MRTNLKKFMVFVLSLVMVVTAVPVSTFADRPYYSSDLDRYYRMDYGKGSQMGYYTESSDWGTPKMGVNGAHETNHHIWTGSNILLSDYLYVDDRTSLPENEEPMLRINNTVCITLEGENVIGGGLEVTGNLTINGSGSLVVGTISASGVVNINGGVVDCGSVLAKDLVVSAGYLHAGIIDVENEYSQTGGYVKVDEERCSLKHVEDNSYRILEADYMMMHGGYLNVLSSATHTDLAVSRSVYGIYLKGSTNAAIDGCALYIDGGYVDVDISSTGCNSNTTHNAYGICLGDGTTTAYAIGGILNVKTTAYSRSVSGSTTTWASNPQIGQPIKGIVLDDVVTDKDITNYQIKGGEPQNLGQASYTKFNTEYYSDGRGFYGGNRTWYEVRLTNSWYKGAGTTLTYVENGSLDIVKDTFIEAALPDYYELEDVVFKDNAAAIGTKINKISGTVYIPGDYTFAAGADLTGAGTVVVDGNVTLAGVLNENIQLFVTKNLVLEEGSTISGSAVVLGDVYVAGDSKVEQNGLLSVIGMSLFTEPEDAALDVFNGLELAEDVNFTIAGNVSVVAPIAVKLNRNSHIMAGAKADFDNNKTADGVRIGVLTVYGGLQAVDADYEFIYDELEAAGDSEDFEEIKNYKYTASINGMADAWCDLYTNHYANTGIGYGHYVTTETDLYWGYMFEYLGLEYAQLAGFDMNYVNTNVDYTEVFGNRCAVYCPTDYYLNVEYAPYRAARFELGNYPVWIGHENQLTFDNCVNEEDGYAYYQAGDRLHTSGTAVLMLDGFEFDDDCAGLNESNSNYFKYERLGVGASVLAYEDLDIYYDGETVVGNPADAIDCYGGFGYNLSLYGIYGLYNLGLYAVDKDAVLEARGGRVYSTDAKYHAVSAGIGAGRTINIEGGTINAYGGDVVNALSTGIYCGESMEVLGGYGLTSNYAAYKLPMIDDGLGALWGNARLFYEGKITVPAISYSSSNAYLYYLMPTANGTLFSDGEGSSVYFVASDYENFIIANDVTLNVAGGKQIDGPSSTVTNTSNGLNAENVYAHNTVINAEAKESHGNQCAVMVEGRLCLDNATVSAVGYTHGIHVVGYAHGKNIPNRAVMGLRYYGPDNFTYINYLVEEHAYGNSPFCAVLATGSSIQAQGLDGIYVEHGLVELVSTTVKSVAEKGYGILIDTGALFAEKSNIKVNSDLGEVLEGTTKYYGKGGIVIGNELGFGDGYGEVGYGNAFFYNSTVDANVVNDVASHNPLNAGIYADADILSLFSDINVNQNGTFVGSKKYSQYGMRADDDVNILGGSANVTALKTGLYAASDVYLGGASITFAGIEFCGMDVEDDLDVNNVIDIAEGGGLHNAVVNVSGKEFGVRVGNDLRIAAFDPEEVAEEYAPVLFNVNSNAVAIYVEGDLDLEGHYAMINAVAGDFAIAVGYDVDMEDGYIYATASQTAVVLPDGVLSLDAGYKLIRTSPVAGIKAGDKSMAQYILPRVELSTDKEYIPHMANDDVVANTFTYANAQYAPAKTVELYFPSSVLIDTSHDVHDLYDGITGTELDMPLRDRLAVYDEAKQDYLVKEVAPYQLVDVMLSGTNFFVDSPVSKDVDKWFTYTNGKEFGTEPIDKLGDPEVYSCAWKSEKNYGTVYFEGEDNAVVTSESAILDQSESFVMWLNEYGNYVITRPVTTDILGDFADAGITYSGNKVTFENVTIDLDHYENDASYDAISFSGDTEIVLKGHSTVLNNNDNDSNARNGITADGKLTVSAIGNGSLKIDAQNYGISAPAFDYVSGALKIGAGEEAVRTKIASANVSNNWQNTNVIGSTNSAVVLTPYSWNGNAVAFVPASETSNANAAKFLEINTVNVTGVAILESAPLNINRYDGSTARNITLSTKVSPEGANQYVHWTAPNGFGIAEEYGTKTAITVPAGLADGDYLINATTLGVDKNGDKMTATYKVHVYYEKPTEGGGTGDGGGGTGGGGGGTSGGGGGGGSSTPAPQPVKVETVWKDVDPARYYYDALQWAFDNAIIDGVSANKFGIGNNISRAELFDALYKAAGSPKVSATATIPFKDVAKNAKYYDAVVWAYTTGLTNGAGAADVFAPDMELDRAQIVTILWRYSGSKVQAGKIQFTDVEKGRYYEKAVDWATANGIINGTGDGTTFSPTELMLKESAITMLYRKFVKALF